MTEEEKILKAQEEKEQEEDAKGVEDISTSQFLQHEAEVYAVAFISSELVSDSVSEAVTSASSSDEEYSSAWSISLLLLLSVL